MNRTLRAIRDRASNRGQSGFVLLAGLTVWLLVGGVMMSVLLDMTLNATQRATFDAQRAQQLRGIDAAMETALLVIQTDGTGTVAVPDGKGGCAAGPGGAPELRYEDGLGAVIEVTASCDPPSVADGPVVVRLRSRVVEPATSVLLVGSARLEVTPIKGAGNRVKVDEWSVVTPPDVRDVDIAAGSN